MSNSILMVKLEKKNNEWDSLYSERRKLYKKAIDKHNLMVWSTLNTNEKNSELNMGGFNNIPFICESGYETTFESMVNEDEYKKYNLAFDSGFDIFQPIGESKCSTSNTGETKSYDLDIGSHLIGLGLKSAMYDFKDPSSIWETADELVENKFCIYKRITIYNNLLTVARLWNTETWDDHFNLIHNIQRDINKQHEGNRYILSPTPFKLHPRSSIYKKAIRMANSTGIIDSGYRGELCAAVDCLGQAFGKQTDPDRMALQPGKRYFQICKADLQPFYAVLLNENDELPTTDRGEGGFGSTGQ